MTAYDAAPLVRAALKAKGISSRKVSVRELPATIGALTEQIRRLDAEQAPGSETRLLTEYFGAIMQLYGLPFDADDDWDRPVEPDVARWWVAAYEERARSHAR